MTQYDESHDITLYWQKRHEIWDLSPSEGQLAGQAAWFEERFAHLFPDQHMGQRVLDFGCGSGCYSVNMNRHFDLYYGVDTSVKAIEIARRYFGHPNNLFSVIEVDKPLPFADGFFDCVLTVTVLQHQPPKRRQFYVNEIKRVLKPGGLYVGMEWQGGTAAFDMPAVAVVDWLDWWKPMELTYDIPKSHPEWSANNVWYERKP